MADNVDITPGSGATVAADLIGGALHQRVKISIGADGSASDLPFGQAAMASSLPVTMANNQGPIQVSGTVTVAASENHLGWVGGSTTVLDFVVASVTGAYASGDMVGVELIVTGSARVAGGSGLITGLTVIDYAAQSVAGELWITDTAVTEPANNASWSLSDADAAHVVTVIPFTAWYASALNSVSPNGNLSLPYKCVAGSTSLYCCFVTRGAPTYGANGLLLRLFVSQD